MPEPELAPVIPLRPVGAVAPAQSVPTGSTTDPVEAARAALLRKLRSRSLSVSEARRMLAATEVSATQREEILDDLVDHGYLNDTALAEQLVHAETVRRGKGTRAVAQVLAGRGVDREVINTALAELPDDDDERAREFAQRKAASMARLDPQTAQRRLVGQLMRRGYPGALSARVAREALASA